MKYAVSNELVWLEKENQKLGRKCFVFFRFGKKLFAGTIHLNTIPVCIPFTAFVRLPYVGGRLSLHWSYRKGTLLQKGFSLASLIICVPYSHFCTPPFVIIFLTWFSICSHFIPNNRNWMKTFLFFHSWASHFKYITHFTNTNSFIIIF